MKITDDNYNDILTQPDRLVVIDFWATWCGPCQRLSPIVEALAEEYDGRAIIGKYNVENNEELLERFGIRNVPTVLFIKNEEVLERVAGVVNKDKLKEITDKHL